MNGFASELAICILVIGIGHSTLCFNLEILHTNDVHARIEQFDLFGSHCSEKNAADGKCYGGVARRSTKIKEIRDRGDNVVLLDAGDQFSGSQWFSLYQGKAAAVFMERLGYDAMCFGNHEFDLGDGAIADFIDNVTFPVVSANIEVTSDSPLYQKFTKSVTLTVGGEKIGIVGYTTTETRVISFPSKSVQFHDVIPSVREEVNRLTGQGINKIIALGHAGYFLDLEVAKIEGVDVVVGGHTNTFLYTGQPPSIDVPTAPYPRVVVQGSGKRALVVQDANWGKYLGHLNVTFDDMGVVEAWSGNPILLDKTVPKDADIVATVNEMGKEVIAQNMKVVGSTNVFLDGRRENCYRQECNMANLFMDSIINFYLTFSHSNNSWAPASIALYNSGAIRSSMQKGDVSVGTIYSVLQFYNEVVLLTVRGSNLREQLEHSVRGLDSKNLKGKFLQFSGLRVVYDARKVEQRVLSVEVRCLECDIPSYSPLIDTAEYKILVNTFMSVGGDGYDFQPIELVRFDNSDKDILTTYFRRHSPVYSSLEGRISFKTPGETTSTSSMNVCSSYIVLLAALLLLTQR